MFKQSIKFKPDLFELVLKRKKMSTVRKGLRDYTLGDPINEQLTAIFTHVYRKPFRKLTKLLTYT